MANTKIHNNYNVYYNNDNTYAPFIETNGLSSVHKLCYNINCYNLFGFKDSLVHNILNGLSHDAIINMRSMYRNSANIFGTPVCGNNVIDMSGAYSNCNNVNGQPVCGPNVTNMAYTYFMYGYYNWQVPFEYIWNSNIHGNPVCGNKVTNMFSTYDGCVNLTGSPVCGPNVVDMAHTYANSTVSGVAACGDKVTNMYCAYSSRLDYNSTSGTYSTLSNITQAVCGNNVIDMSEAYKNCYKLTGDAVCGNNVLYMYEAYSNCIGLNGTAACGDNVVDLINTYTNCHNLKTPVCGDKVTNMFYTYENCWALTGEPVCGPNVVNYWSPYRDCNNIRQGTVILGNNVVEALCSYYPWLTTLPASYPSTLKYMVYESCDALTGAPWVDNNWIHFEFDNCLNITGSPVCGINIVDMSLAYRNCYQLTGSPVCSDKVTNMLHTYNSCYNLTGAPVCGNNVIDMQYAYSSCSNLSGLPACGPNVTTMCGTYANCYNLTGSPVCGDKVTNIYAAYSNCYNLTGEPIIGNNVAIMNLAFDNANRISGNIYLYNIGEYKHPWGWENVNAGVAAMFGGRSNDSLRINLHVILDSTMNNVIYNSNTGYRWDSILGFPFTWETGTNCYYNSQYNFYVYYDL